MAFSFDQIFAADPANPQNVASNAAVLIYAPGDTLKTPLALTDPSGNPISNPVIVNANGFGTAFMADIDRVAWDGGGFTGFFTSYEGMKQVAVAAQTAAETAAATAGAEAAAIADAAITVATDEASAAATAAAASATAAANSAALVGAPADAAIAAAVNGTGATKTALNATYGDPDDVGYDIVLLLGQSNMSGWANDGDTRLNPADPRVYQYGSNGTYADKISTAVEPLAQVDTPVGIGPGMVFARWYANSVPGTRRILLVPAAKGGTPFEGNSAPTGFSWKVGRTDVTNLYDNAVTQANKAKAAAGPTSRIVAALWLQGESDGDNNTSAATYQADLDALINGLRTALALPNLPFVIGQMVPEYLGTGTRSAINGVHAGTPARIAKTAFSWAPLAGNRTDGHHFNAAGQREIGRNMFQAYRRIVIGGAETPLPAAPAAMGTISTSNVLGTQLTLTWAAPARGGSYLIERSVSPYSSWTNLGATTATTYNATGLTATTAYRFRVTPVNNGGVGTASTVDVTTGAPSSITDSFNRANGTLGVTDTGETWTILESGGAWGIVSNQASMTTPKDTSKAVVPFAAPDQTVTVKVPTLTWTGTAMATENMGVVARCADLSNYYTAVVAANGAVSMFKRVANTFTVLGTTTAAGTLVAGNTLAISAIGTTIKALVNGTAVITVTDTAHSAAGSVGLGNGGTLVKYWDDFSAVPS